ncbi:MAG: transcription termination factor NusA [Planctomycetes bacterium]|nr:transcription termination factor NusA [Planctomycetota bacterium]
MNEEFLRLLDSIHKDKGVDREVLFTAVEQGLATAAKKRFGLEDITVTIDRQNGRATAVDSEGNEVDINDLGRIAARTAYQVMTQKIREAASTVIVDEYQNKIGSIVVGSVQRFERGNMIVSLDRAEALVPRSEQVYNESYRPGDRIRSLLLDIRRERSKVQMILSRTNDQLVHELFKLEVPEIGEGTVTIKKLVRDPGNRTKLAVASDDPRVDPVGACVGVRGSRIRTIVDELNGEHIDIVPWSEDHVQFIQDALRPAEVLSITLDEEKHTAIVKCSKEDLSRAIGRRGQNVRLSSRLSGWEIDVSADESSDAPEDAAPENPAPDSHGPDNAENAAPGEPDASADADKEEEQ